MEQIELIVQVASGVLMVGLIFGTLSAFAASARGHSVELWFAMGMLFGPIAFVALLVKSANVAAIENRLVKTGKMKRCPRCAEVVKPKAQVCRYCGNEF